MMMCIKWMTMSLLVLALLSVPISSASGQTPTTEAMCVTKADFHSAVHDQCRDLKARADQYTVCRGLLTTQTNELNSCAGQLKLLRDIDTLRVAAERRAERAMVERYSVWTVGTVGVLGVAVGVLVTVLVLSN
jgi:hypothetical protein